MSTYEKRKNSKVTRFSWIGDRALSTQKQKSRSLFLSLHKIWQFFLAISTGENELRIWQTSDHDGNTWWHGCDRATGRSICAATENEMRAWIDRRYCQ
jgi:hypothetical protein